MKIWLRKIHRWLGLLMAFQIIAWMGSGLYFAWFPIETIRGEHLVREAATPVVSELDDMVPVWVAWNNLSKELDVASDSLEIAILGRGGRTYYRMSGISDGGPFVRLVDGYTGQIRPPLEEEEALHLALSMVADGAEVIGVDWVTESEPGSEIRGRQLPVWRIRFSEPESLNLYLHPWTGEVLARRTARWRVFDFLWMLHIMDFDTRDDFNTPLLQLAAALGLLIALSGVIYWGMTTRLFRKS